MTNKERLEIIKQRIKTNKHRQFKKCLPSTFNLWEGKKYKSNILKYKKDYLGKWSYVPNKNQ